MVSCESLRYAAQLVNPQTQQEPNSVSAVDLPIEETTKQQNHQQTLQRRRLLETGFWTASGLAGLAITGVGARFLVGNALEPKAEQWTKVEEVAKLIVGKVHRTIYRVRSKDGWRSAERSGVLYAFSADGVEYHVLDATCSHLGCNVHWREEMEQFRCPCHEGIFDREGQVVSGPPPRSLTQLQTKIEDGILYALL
jgi:Rieske Fe-S protein